MSDQMRSVSRRDDAAFAFDPSLPLVNGDAPLLRCEGPLHRGLGLHLTRLLGNPVGESRQATQAPVEHCTAPNDLQTLKIHANTG